MSHPVDYTKSQLTQNATSVDYPTHATAEISQTQIPSASEVKTLWRYTNLLIIIIIITRRDGQTLFLLTDNKCILTRNSMYLGTRTLCLLTQLTQYVNMIYENNRASVHPIIRSDAACGGFAAERQARRLYRSTAAGDGGHHQWRHSMVLCSKCEQCHVDS